ncbi:MAG: hypothetical protein Q9182_000962 [Xanthomendoza sp. 2 TL-2023]
MTRVLYGKPELRLSKRGCLSLLTIFTKLAGCWEDVADHLSLHGPNETTPPRSIERLNLYDVNMPADGSLEVIMEVRKKSDDTGIQMGFYIAYQEMGGHTLEYTYHPLLHTCNTNPITRLPLENSNKRVVELGVYINGVVETSTPMALFEIESIVIKPRAEITSKRVKVPFLIEKIHLVEQLQGSRVQKRISWTWAANPDPDAQVWPEGMPWSEMTGPFSSFAVHVDSRFEITAHCNQCWLTLEELEDLDERFEICVIGTLFGGGRVCSPMFAMDKLDLMNVVEDG